MYNGIQGSVHCLRNGASSIAIYQYLLVLCASFKRVNINELHRIAENDNNIPRGLETPH